MYGARYKRGEEDESGGKGNRCIRAGMGTSRVSGVTAENGQNGQIIVVGGSAPAHPPPPYIFHSIKKKALPV